MKRAELSPAAEIEFRADWLNTEVQMKGLERKFRLSRGTIRRIASELGLPSVRQPTPLWPEGRAEEAARLYREEGLQCGEIVKRWGMTRNQVNSKLDRMGVLRRRASEPTVAEARAASEAARAAAPKAPEVKRAPYQNAGLAFGTRKIAKAAKPKLMLLGNGTVAEGAPSVQAIATATEAPGLATMLTLGPCMCKWPIGDPQDAGFTFCGRGTGGTYCEEHHARAYNSDASAKEKDRKLLKSARRAA